MYDRRLEGRTLRFGHAGILFNNSFVMYDHGTDSLWVQVTGEAYAGPLKGRRLRFLPATVSSWAEWRAAYPHTTVLPGRRSTTFMGTFDAIEQPERVGLSVVVRFRAKLYPFARLAEQPLVNDSFAGVPLLAVYTPETRAAMAWGRTVAGRVLSFAAADAGGPALMRDRETGSLWSQRTGEAVAGPLQGRALPALTAHPILVERFHAFYPGAPVYGTPAGAAR